MTVLRTGAWAVCGALVILYVFFVAIGGVDPVAAGAATLVVVALAAGWLAHSWRALMHGGGSSRADRERRGF